MKAKKRAITLLEIMIVIFLIGLIGSVVGYNMKGSMDKGRAFKTKQAIERIHDILLLAIAEGATVADVSANPATYLEASGMVKNAQEMLKDGWGGSLQVVEKDDDVEITSANLQKYEDKFKVKNG